MFLWSSKCNNKKKEILRTANGKKYFLLSTENIRCWFYLSKYLYIQSNLILWVLNEISLGNFGISKQSIFHVWRKLWVGWKKIFYWREPSFLEPKFSNLSFFVFSALHMLLSVLYLLGTFWVFKYSSKGRKIEKESRFLYQDNKTLHSVQIFLTFSVPAFFSIGVTP